MTRRAVICAALAALAAGCSFGPAPTPAVAVYDLGVEPPQPLATRVRASLAIDNVSAPSWLHSPAILYRLLYQDAARVQPYSRARWAAAPSTLLDQRLRLAFEQAAQHGVASARDGVRSDFVLRIELDGFTQVLDSPSAARAVVRARASLIDTREHSLLAQRSFTVERACPSVDATGAVRSLSAAADILITQLIEWTARETTARR